MADETPAEFLKRTTSRGGPASGAPQPGQETPAQFLARTAPKAGDTTKTAETTAPDVPSVDDYAGQDSVNRIIETGVQAYRNTPSFWTSPTGQSTRAQVENMDPYGFGRFIVAPAGDLVAGAFGVGAGLLRGGQEMVRSAIAPINPLLARDIAALPEAFPTGFGNMRPRPRANPLEPPQFIDERMPLSPEFMANPLTPEARTAASRAITDPNALTTPTGIRLAPPPSDAVTGQGGPRVGGAPPGVTPGGLTPEQLAEFDKIPDALPPQRKEIRTRQDAADRADEIIHHFASIGNKEPLPGAEGSLPSITQNSGLATLYRAVRDKDTPVPFETAETNIKKAVKAKLDAMSGTQDDLDAAARKRSATVEPMYKQAWANKTEADPSGAIKTVEDLMESPLKQNDTAMAELRNIHKKLQGQTDPEQLKGITDSIDETIARLKPEGKADRRTLGALDQVDKVITAEISRTTPGFDAAQATFANLSRRIDEMKYFQGRKLTDLQGNPTLGNMRSTLDDIAKKQAGDKFHPADSVTEENLKTLKLMHDQMQRESFTASAGKSLGGSNTFQNLATDSVLRQVGKQVGANLLGTGGGYLADLAAGGGGVTGAVVGNITGNALQGVRTVRAAQAEARQAAGQAMLMKELRERLLNVNNKGVESLRRSP